MAFRYSRYHYHKGTRGRCECPMTSPEHVDRVAELVTELHSMDTELSRLEAQYNQIRQRGKKLLHQAARFVPIRGKLQLEFLKN